MEPECEEYLLQAESQFVFQDIMEDELNSFCNNFYSQVDSLWGSPLPTISYNYTTDNSLVAGIHESLQKSFAARVLQDWLQKIAQATTNIVDSQVSVGEQLVECVQSVLPAWEEEDLLVLARPVAYAMRSGNNSQSGAAN
ncbi:FIG00875589: hypothetical protein [Richelia intracellularis]|nr:FIG00875589: hypothetical protein [Richelia intracellularis]